MAKYRVKEKTLMWIGSVCRMAEPGEIVEYEGEVHDNLELIPEEPPAEATLEDATPVATSEAPAEEQAQATSEVPADAPAEEQPKPAGDAPV